MWIGLFAAPLGFTLEHVAGWGVSEANCEVVGRQWGISFTGWAGGLAAVGAAAAAGGLVAAALAYRAVKGTDNDADPPGGRIWLMSVCGLVVSSLLLILIILSGTGALLLDHCHQS